MVRTAPTVARIDKRAAPAGARGARQCKAMGSNAMNLRVELLLFMTGWGANHFSTLLVVYRKNLGSSMQALLDPRVPTPQGLVPGLVLAGRASDHRGRRAVVLPASLLAILASAVLALGAHGFGVLLAGRLLYGLATADR